MKSQMKIVALSVLALTMALPALASDKEYGDKPHHKRDPQHIIKKMDTDNNGTVSKAEFMAKHEKMFEKIDADKDGKLTEAEFKAAHEKMKKMREERKGSESDQ